MAQAALRLQNFEEKVNEKVRKDDRILVLKPIDGQDTLNGAGIVDNRLFTGENKLHVILNPRTCMWTFKYEMGGLPLPMQQKFTNFKYAYEYAAKYFKSRGLQITEVID